MKKFWRFCLPALTLVSLLFIFSNSLKPVEDVDRTKEKVVGTVESVVESVVGKDISLDFLKEMTISKIGHLLEYTVFGTLFTFTVYYRREAKKKEYFFPIMFSSAFVAISDEHLQHLGQGRNPSLIDVIIDLAACMIGFVLAGFFYRILERRENGKRRSDS